MCERERVHVTEVEAELAEAVENVRARDDDVCRLEKNEPLPENLFSALNKYFLRETFSLPLLPLSPSASVRRIESAPTTLNAG